MSKVAKITGFCCSLLLVMSLILPTFSVYANSDGKEVIGEVSSVELPYFKTTKNAIIYKGDINNLKPVGELKANYMFKREVRVLGNWVTINFGGDRAFIKKSEVSLSATKESQATPAPGRNMGQLTMRQDTNVYLDKNSSNAFAVIKKGEHYPYIVYEGGFYKIELNGLIGYVKTDTASVIFPAGSKFFQVIHNEVPIYSNENAGAQIIGYLQNGMNYPRLGETTNGFHEIRFQAGTGYVNIKDTIPSTVTSVPNYASGSGTVAGTLEISRNTNVYSDTSGKNILFILPANSQYPFLTESHSSYYEVRIGDMKGYIKKLDANKAVPLESPYYKAILPEVPIFYSNNGVLSEVAQLKSGDIVRINGTLGTNWYKLQMGNNTGYVLKESMQRTSGDNIKNVNTNILGAAGYFQTKGNPVPVYDNSGGTLVPFMSLGPNKLFNFNEDSGSNWYKVQVGHRIGYVSKSLVNEVTPKISGIENLALYRDKDSALNYTLQSNKVANVPYGQEVGVLEISGYVSKVITSDGIEGWVYSNNLRNHVNEQDWIVREYRNLRAEPNASSTTIGGVGTNAKVKVLEYTIGNDANFKHWYKVKLENGTTGWMWGAKNNNSTGLVIHPYDFKAKTMNPANQLDIHTPLETITNFTADQINKFLDYKIRLGGSTDNNVLYGMGATFLEASRQTGISVIYLISHASLETAWGRSQIARDKFNYFGIAAYDHDPYGNAYDFSSKEKGITEGARWIFNNYTSKGQDTIHSMRMNNGSHQYATDEAWHHKISNIAKDLVGYIGNLTK